MIEKAITLAEKPANTNPTKQQHKERPVNPLKKQIGGNHYKQFSIQPVEFSHQNNLSFLAGCVVKRLCRYNLPGGKGLEDVEKSLHELDIMIDQHRKGHEPQIYGDIAISPALFCSTNGIEGRRAAIIEQLTNYHHHDTSLKILSNTRDKCNTLLQELLEDAADS